MGATGKPSPPPSPAALFEAVRGYQNSYVLKAGVDLDVFTAIAKGSHTATEIAKATSASARGVRILCDALTVLGFLVKTGSNYSLTPDSAVFLDSRSPAYLGKALKFLVRGARLVALEGMPQSLVLAGKP